MKLSEKRRYNSTAVGFPIRKDLCSLQSSFCDASTSPACVHAHRNPKNTTKIMQKKLNVLIACEESQAETLAFRNLGHSAFSCDIQPCKPKGHPEWHIQADVTPYLEGKTTFETMDGIRHDVGHWDLIVAHPPCTYLCKLSSVHMCKDPDYKVRVGKAIKFVNRDRFNKMRKGRQFFLKCLAASAPYVAVENPLPMRMAELPPATCFADPSWYGVKYTKKTLYWLKNLPPLMPTILHPNPRCFVTASRGKYRSRTFPQLAEALATQWSSYILEDMERKQKLA